MAIKSVFLSQNTYPFFEEIAVMMDWFPGVALSQKRKNELSLHANFLQRYPSEKVLEISSASLTVLGQRLSAMNLSKLTSDGRTTTVESAFQSSRIYRDGGEQIGPFHDLLYASGREAKRKVKEASRGLHSYEYDFEGMTFGAPEYHISLFYDYLYLTALMEPANAAVRDDLLEGSYTAFSDLASPALNCQARSCAIFVGLAHAGLLDELSSPEQYLTLFRTAFDGHSPLPGTDPYEQVQLLFHTSFLKLRSPLVIQSVPKVNVISLYKKYYSGLSNKPSEVDKVPGGISTLGIDI